MRRRKKRKLQNDITPIIDVTPLPSRRWKKVRKRKRQKYFEEPESQRSSERFSPTSSHRSSDKSGDRYNNIANPIYGKEHHAKIPSLGRKFVLTEDNVIENNILTKKIDSAKNTNSENYSINEAVRRDDAPLTKAVTEEESPSSKIRTGKSSTARIKVTSEEKSPPENKLVVASAYTAEENSLVIPSTGNIYTLQTDSSDRSDSTDEYGALHVFGVEATTPVYTIHEYTTTAPGGLRVEASTSLEGVEASNTSSPVGRHSSLIGSIFNTTLDAVSSLFSEIHSSFPKCDIPVTPVTSVTNHVRSEPSQDNSHKSWTYFPSSLSQSVTDRFSKSPSLVSSPRTTLNLSRRPENTVYTGNGGSQKKNISRPLYFRTEEGSNEHTMHQVTSKITYHTFEIGDGSQDQDEGHYKVDKEENISTNANVNAGKSTKKNGKIIGANEVTWSTSRVEEVREKNKIKFDKAKSLLNKVKSNFNVRNQLGFIGDNYLRMKNLARSSTTTTPRTTPITTTPKPFVTTKAGTISQDLLKINQLNDNISRLKAELSLLLNFNENVLDFDSSIVSEAAKTKVENFFVDLSSTIETFLPSSSTGSSTDLSIVAAETVLDAGDDIANSLASTVELGGQMDIALPNISMSVMKKEPLPDSVSTWENNWLEVELPDQEAITGEDNSIALAFSSYENLGDLMGAESQVSSPVLSVIALGEPSGMQRRGGRRWTELEAPVKFSARHGPVPKHSSVSCVYWDFPTSTWLTDGCTSLSISEFTTSCSCSHLTSFSLLINPLPAPATPSTFLFSSEPSIGIQGDWDDWSKKIL